MRAPAAPREEDSKRGLDRRGSILAMSRPRRAAGILLHPTSLPSRFGIGDLGPASDAFLDWAADSGLTLWQILPLVPPGAHDSPYAGLSAFAGNPLLI